MKKIKDLQQIAKQIFEYETLLQQDKTRQDIQSKIENIMMSLSLEEMLLLDDIIYSRDF